MSTTSPNIVAVDVDSHEMIPLQLWEENFGPEMGALIDVVRAFETGPEMAAALSVGSQPNLTGDEQAITQDSVWNTKGPQAPGAIDMSRRTDVLRAMGVEKQLVFPTMALRAITLAHNPAAPMIYGYDPAEVDGVGIGRAALDAYNRWVADIMLTTGQAGVVPVGALMTDTVDGMMSQARGALSAGVRAFWIQNGVPPADMSPANRALDPFWALLAEADVPALLHLGTEPALISWKWRTDVPEFSYGRQASIEFAMEPFSGMTLNLANETFLTTMILGGVFERHPALRFGVIECGAQWVGGFADRLDTWASQFSKRLDALSVKPSAYLARNVRVTPFYFEPVASYFERWPELATVFTYSSDYPHEEGGRESKKVFYEKLAPLGEDILHKFFYANGKFLIPD